MMTTTGNGMTAKDLDDTLKTIAANAKAMRDAGVVGRVVANGVEFELDSPEPPPVPLVQTSDASPVAPLDDAVTYGTSEVPTRRRPLSHDAARAEFEKE
jgi:hypothetical protein